MKKDIKKLFVLICTILIIPAISGVIINDFMLKKPVQAAQELSPAAIQYSPEEVQNLEFDQIKQGDYSALQGRWINEKGERASRISVEGSKFFYHGEKYFLSFGGETERNYPYLHTFSVHLLKNAASVYYYPKGTAIPIRLASGEIDDSGEADPTDINQDRILFAQTILSPEELKNEVCYRENL